MFTKAVYTLFYNLRPCLLGISLFHSLIHPTLVPEALAFCSTAGKDGLVDPSYCIDVGDKAGTLTLSIPEGTRMDPPKQTLQETLQATKRTLTGFRVQNVFEFKVPLNPDIQDHKVVKVHVPLYIYTSALQ